MKFLRSLQVKLGLIRDPVEHSYQQVESLQSLVNELAHQEQRPHAEIYDDLVNSALARCSTNSEQWTDWDSLSPREQEVTALTCLGYTNNEIASKLGVSVPTVKTHIRHVLIKFQLHSKSELRMVLRDWNFRGWDRGPHM